MMLKSLIVLLLAAVPASGGTAGTTADARNFFTKAYTGSRNDFTGNVGYEFVPAATIRVTALGRSVGGGRLRRNHRVTLWNVATHQPLARVVVSPASTVDARGFACERMDHPVTLEDGVNYRITSFEEAGGDPFFDLADLPEHSAVAALRSGVYSVGDAYPATSHGGAGQGYGVPTLFFDVLPPSPFVRDVTTGYLLNYCFMSPRPYCWPGEDCLLSGWDVDRAGGHFEFHPTCRYPAGFAFHSDWFKLVDTSTNAAVTLKHRIARQTKGQLTLEFRFTLPARMDGACWQLRDLEQAGVSVVTVGGNLCWETGRVLAPYEANREYGVKVVADINGKRADVYVDGELKARGVPFVHPIKSIDCFLVKTGDAATGEMFLNPVNIYKGYAVNETFVTCGVGKVPADWKVTGGSVEQFECGSKPDVYSLKLNGEASKTFAPIETKTVFECRFLLPGKAHGVRVELGGVTLPGVASCRSNLWYLVKVIADPVTLRADVFINGKPAAKQIAFARSIAAVRFAGNLWVDDVQVYPWRDYPADYVPEPKPVVASHLLGAQSCNLWREGTAYAGWDYVYPYRDRRKPHLGWYDEGNPEETDWEIKWQVEHGIAFEQHCWYRPNNAINHPIKDAVLDQGIIKGLFNARYSHLAKFTIMCTDEGACETNPRDWRENVIPYWIEYFFKDPRYLKIDGKPVLSIYHLGNWLRMFGGPAGGRQAIQTLRDEVAKAGFPGIIVLMEQRSADRNVLQTMKALGVDACYAYTWGTWTPVRNGTATWPSAMPRRRPVSRCCRASRWAGTGRRGACVTAAGCPWAITRR